MGLGKVAAGLAVVAGLAGVIFAAALLSRGQSGGPAILRQSTRPGMSDGLDSDPVWNAKRVRALNADRQKSMVSDAEKLVKVARQLDAEVASNSKDELTPQELHKVAEIEKLARSVKSKMALSFTGGPLLQGQPAQRSEPEGSRQP